MANENPLLAIHASDIMSKPLHPHVHNYYNIFKKEIQPTKQKILTLTKQKMSNKYIIYFMFAFIDK